MNEMKKARILLVSDMHYTDFVGSGELAVSDVLGATQQERLAYLNEIICAEHEKAPLDAVLMLGDYSVDDYPWRSEAFGKENYCRKYYEEYLTKLPMPVYTLPGNHDSYPDELWLQSMHQPRQYCVMLGGVRYVMLDTFHGIGHTASGAPYTGVDCTWLNAQLTDKTPTVLCAHYFKFSAESDAFREILCTHEEIIALFQGHTHVQEAHRLPAEWGGKPFYDTGCFSYNCYNYTDENGKDCWDFNHYDPESAWGYGILETNGADFTAKYIYPAHTYHGSNGDFDLPETVISGNADALGAK